MQPVETVGARQRPDRDPVIEGRRAELQSAQEVLGAVVAGRVAADRVGRLDGVGDPLSEGQAREGHDDARRTEAVRGCRELPLGRCVHLRPVELRSVDRELVGRDVHAGAVEAQQRLITQARATGMIGDGAIAVGGIEVEDRPGTRRVARLADRDIDMRLASQGA